ncbi:MAG TPA: hypothetical protein PK735_13475, partial [Flavobacteriales bacterium]|nr:hypothetical protein [Flavobacteriales bacterium]
IIMEKAWPFIAGFAVSGIGLFTGLSMLVWGALEALLAPGPTEEARLNGTIGIDLAKVDASRRNGESKTPVHQR